MFPSKHHFIHTENFYEVTIVHFETKGNHSDCQILKTAEKSDFSSEKPFQSYFFTSLMN